MLELAVHIEHREFLVHLLEDIDIDEDDVKSGDIYGFIHSNRFGHPTCQFLRVGADHHHLHRRPIPSF